MNDNLKKYADLLRDGGVLVEANPRGFTVEDQDEQTTFRTPGGLTQEHYNLLAPPLSSNEQAELAIAAIANTFCISDVGWLEMKGIINSRWDDFEAWLLEQIRLDGFDTVAKRIEEWWTKYRPPIHRPTSSL